MRPFFELFSRLVAWVLFVLGLMIVWIAVLLASNVAHSHPMDNKSQLICLMKVKPVYEMVVKQWGDTGEMYQDEGFMRSYREIARSQYIRGNLIIHEMPWLTEEIAERTDVAVFWETAGTDGITYMYGMFIDKHDCKVWPANIHWPAHKRIMDIMGAVYEPI